MPNTIRSSKTMAFTGLSISQNVNITVNSQLVIKKTTNLHKSGSLTTRTDDNTGTVTMSTGHGITTGQKVDVYWNGGVRYNMTVGTVSGNSVPIDLGGGDNLPSSSTAVNLCVPVVSELLLTGDRVVAFAFGGKNRCHLTFFDNTTVVYTAQVEAASIFAWDSNEIAANPLAGLSITSVAITQGSGSVAEEVRAGFGVLDA